jgi:hypothetical protein
MVVVSSDFGVHQQILKLRTLLIFHHSYLLLMKKI